MKIANPMYAPLGEANSRFVRQEARISYRNRYQVFGVIFPDRDIVADHFRNRFIASGRFRGRYGSGTLLLALAVRLAVALFFYWLENYESDVPASGFQAGEPGTLPNPVQSVKRLWTRKN